jgi:hypothetical protein
MGIDNPKAQLTCYIIILSPSYYAVARKRGGKHKAAPMCSYFPNFAE